MKRRGVALIVVLGTAALLSLIVGLMALSSQALNVGSAVAAERTTARYAAESALAETVWLLLADDGSLPVNRAPYPLALPCGGTAEVVVRDANTGFVLVGARAGEGGLERIDDRRLGWGDWPPQRALRRRDTAYWIPGADALRQTLAGDGDWPADAFRVIPPVSHRWPRGPSFPASSPAMVAAFTELAPADLKLALDIRRAWQWYGGDLEERLGPLAECLGRTMTFADSGVCTITVTASPRRLVATLDRRARDLDHTLTWWQYRRE